MTKYSGKPQLKYLTFLRRSRKKAVIAMAGCFLAAFSLLLLVYAI